MAKVSAYGKNELTFTAEAGGDLSAKQYCGVKFSSGQVVAATAQGEAIVGVLQNNPSVAGRAAVIAYAGISEVLLGGTVSQGNKLTVTATGAFELAAVADEVAGYALSDGVSGERIPAIITLAGVL